MKANARSSQLRNKAALAVAASRDAGNATDRDDLLTKAKGLEMLATAEEWLDDVRGVPSSEHLK
jgi:hypothetical protein